MGPLMHCFEVAEPTTLDETARRGAEEAEVTGEARASAWYRQQLMQTLIDQALRQAEAGR